MEKYILIYGTPIDGFTIVGPFDGPDDAIKHAEDNRIDADWWITIIHDPARHGEAESD